MDEIKEISEEVVSKLFERGLVPVEISARHIHITREHADILFGKGYEFTKVRELSQPGEFLYKERVNIIGKKGTIENVAILGPCRDETQVELSMTDARSIGVSVPVRLSGNAKGAPEVEISANGKKIKGNAIVAKRHIHMREADAKRLGIKNGEIVCVKMLTERPITFEDTVARVNDAFSFSMHIDFDEANACALTGNGFGVIIKGK